MAEYKFDPSVGVLYIIGEAQIIFCPKLLSYKLTLLECLQQDHYLELL